MDQNASMPKEVEGLGWGSSLSVPSVQEMVKQDSINVPERYILEPRDRPQYSSFCDAASDIPVINFSLLANEDEEELKRLDLACREWGFFQMIDHGLLEALQKMKAAVAAFFNLPLEEKRKYAMGKGELQGYGQGFVVSEQQKLEWCDILYLTASPLNKRQLHYWPLVIPGFRQGRIQGGAGSAAAPPCRKLVRSKVRPRGSGAERRSRERSGMDGVWRGEVQVVEEVEWWSCKGKKKRKRRVKSEWMLMRLMPKRCSFAA